MPVIHLTNSNFEETVAQGITVVDFWASWCGPCKILAPTIEELAEKLEGKASVCKVDIDAEPELAMRFGILSIPTVIAFSDGEEKAKLVGVQTLSELEKMAEL